MEWRPTRLWLPILSLKRKTSIRPPSTRRGSRARKLLLFDEASCRVGQCTSLKPKAGIQEQVPPVKKRPATVRLHLFAVIHRRGGRYLDETGRRHLGISDVSGTVVKKIGECRHTITHHRLDVSVYEGKLSPQQLAWKQIDAIPISSLTRKIWNVSRIF